MNLKKILNQKLDKATRAAVLGIGSYMRADDAAGVLIAENIQKALKKFKSAKLKTKVFIGETAPENLTGEIKKFKPSHFIVLDSSDTSQAPGTITIIDPSDAGGISFSTHQMPIKILIDYIQNYVKCSALIIGIQPKSVEYGKPVSKPVLTSIKQVSEALSEILSK